MKALTLTAPNELVYGDVPDPEVAPGEVLIEVRACGICGSDSHGMDGRTSRRIPPLVMGHEATGVIREVGAGVEGWAREDRVTFDSTVFCGACHYCLRGQINLCDRRRVLGVSCAEFRQPGAFAERLTVPVQILHRLPDNVSFRQGTMVEPLAVALHAIGRPRRPIEGPVVVVGAGLIGLMITASLRARGIGPIITLDIDPGRLERAAALGAVTVPSRDQAEAARRVHELTSGEGPGVVFDAVGIDDTVQLAVTMARKGGEVVLVGNLAPRVQLPLQVTVSRELTIYGSAASAGEFPEGIEMIADGRIDIEPFLSVVAPLSDGSLWMQRLQAGDPTLLKVVLEP
jgi:L-iditol 2-dehydrogenase